MKWYDLHNRGYSKITMRACQWLINCNIPTFDGKPYLYFDWILKLENMASVTRWNPRELALGKAQGTVIKCLKSLPPDMIWNNVKTVLWHQFSLVLMVTHVATHLMHRYGCIGESLQDTRAQFWIQQTYPSSCKLWTECYNRSIEGIYVCIKAT